jgi:amiloride-sensitive sodium channel
MVFRYKDGDHFAMIRYRPFKMSDFLAYVGGILGMFAGISVLSVVEMIYFFTIRVACDIVMKMRPNSGQ